MILTLPVIDALKQSFPGATIDFLVNKRVYELVLDYPNINKVHSIEKVTVRGVKSVCKAGNYELAIAVFPRFKIALGLYLGGVKYRLGTGYRWYSFLLNLKHYQHRKEALKHEMEYNLDLLKEINCHINNGITPKLDVAIEDKRNLLSKLLVQNIDPDVEYIVIHVPSLGSAKVWSDQNFIELINLILKEEKLRCNIVLTGTKDEEFHVRFIQNNISDKSRVFVMLDLKMKGLAALLQRSVLFIGNSTGPIHIAAAVGAFVVGLYSPARVESPVRWGPVTGKKKIFVPQIDDNTRNVMDDIKSTEVFEFVKEYLITNRKKNED
ncbi:MAG: glycosyltransferase family 9 protein [Ignavibacteria bacterium]|nr:glycosyltransferase family 9 protein [Ignavibacteria bacterium]